MISRSDILDARILIVDDQEDNILLLRQLLEDEGYQNISSSNDPFAVCTLHRNNKFDLILLDLKMPGRDGFLVMEELNTIEADAYLPVLVITAQPEQKLKALAAGAKDFMSKPLDVLEAKTRIYNMLEVRLLYRELEQYNRILESMALHDELTGLPNRRLLMDRITLSLSHAQRNKSTTALIYLNLNGFKKIYDGMSNDDGKTLLCMIAGRLQKEVRSVDTVARLSNDEFVISLWELSHANGLSELLSRIVHSVTQPYLIEKRNIALSANIGVSLYPAHGDEPETLMASAYKTLHEAKRNGKDDYRIASHTGLLASTHY
jgi:diguanylate cyclase (GGDEF)-like protein